MSAAAIAPAIASKLQLLQHFSSLKDPRRSVKVLYPLEEIVLLLVCATIAGGDDLVELRAWGMEHPAFLRGYLPYRDDVPSHDTLGEVLAAVDAELFKACFADWVAGLQSSDPDVIGIDAKTSRRTHARDKNHKPLPALAEASLREQGQPCTRWRDTRQATRLSVSKD